jgi:hypothetical protein
MMGNNNTLGEGWYSKLVAKTVIEIINVKIVRVADAAPGHMTVAPSGALVLQNGSNQA